VNIVPLEWNTILTIFRAGFGSAENMQYDAMYFSPNTQAPMFAFGTFLTDRIPPAGCCNMMGYSNPEADAVMEQAAATFDLDAQNVLLREFQGIFIREVPAVPVTHDLNLRVLSPQVRGWVQPQSWWGDFKNVWVAE
jgi:peptide/nickel transport system substrate-binding protein